VSLRAADYRWGHVPNFNHSPERPAIQFTAVSSTAMGPDRWLAVERVFLAALVRPAEARAAFLAQECGADEELRRAVESLLARADSTDSVPENDAMAIPLVSATAPAIAGTRIGIYEVECQIGAGAMGEVYRARDTTLGRDVAIKVLPHAFSEDPERLGRFAREARLLAALNHPNIATIHGVVSAEGLHALVLELIEGDTLAERIARSRISLREALTIARQVADALDSAHTQGIVHRDLKPGNIKITPRGTVKVLDFGLAKVTVENIGKRTSAISTHPAPMTIGGTHEGAILGTAAYMSPEQARGEPVDMRTDIWAFGCVLFEMLTGRRAFEGQTIWDSLAGVLQGDPDWNALPRSTPATVRNLLRHCLRKDPNERPPTIADVRDQIDKALAPRALGHIGTAAAAILAFSVVGLITVRYAPSLLPVFGLTDRSETLTSAFNLAQQAATLLERDDKVENVDRAVALLEQALARDVQYTLAYAYLADAYVRKYLLSPDAEWLRRARETAQKAVDLNPDLGAAHVALGRAQLEAGEIDQAVKEFSRAIELDPVNPFPHLGLANAFAGQNQDTKAEAEFRIAIARGAKAWRTHVGFGQFLFERGRYADAATEWEAAGTVSPDNVIVFRNLGAAYYQLGRYEEAASAFQRALEVQPSASIYTNLGTLRFFQGRYAEAVTAFEKAVDLGANAYLNWGNLGDGLRWAPGRRGEAVAAYRRATDLIEKQITQKPEDLNLLTRHAVYLVKMGEREAALKEIAAVAAMPKLAPPILYRLTTVYELAGDRTRALTMLERALKGGYPVKEIDNDPEFTDLRADVRYHRLIDALTHAAR
jgi:tetratricopeptide (TPR) repeat protein